MKVSFSYWLPFVLACTACFESPPPIDAADTDAETSGRTTDTGTSPHSSSDSSSASSGATTESTSTTTNEVTSGETTDATTEATTDATTDTGSTGPGDSACNPAIDSCPEDEKCQLFVEDESACVTTPTPTANLGDACFREASGIDNCAPGLLCSHVADTGFGICAAVCELETLECTNPAAACALPWPEASAGICARTCDPLGQDCPASQGCYDGLGAYFVCLPVPDGGGYATPCDYTCALGLLCIEPAGVPGCVNPSGCCSHLCDTSSPDGGQQCQGYAAGQDCVSYFPDGEAPPDYADVGVCKIPS
jgi:hypothetical protein